MANEPTLFDIQTELQLIRKDILVVCELVKKHETAIYGINGTPGFLARLKDIDDLGETVEKQAATIKEQGKTIDSHGVTLAEYERLGVLEKVREMFPVVKLMSWIGLALGGSIIALIWAILTHAVTIAGKIP